MPGQAAGSRLGALGEIVDPDLPGRTAAGRAGKQPETAGWGLGWDRLPAGSPPGPSRWGPVCLSRALSLWRAAERLVVPPSLSLKWSPWFTQHCGCVLGPRTGGALAGWGWGARSQAVSRPTTGGVLHLQGGPGGQARTLGAAGSGVLGSCPGEGGGSERAQFQGSPRGPQTGNAIPNSSYRFSEALCLHVLHNFLFKGNLASLSVFSNLLKSGLSLPLPLS